ncbi:MAG: hypothetical protein WC389_17355 [Lutibacter sp.]|jgi:hypothetical protein
MIDTKISKLFSDIEKATTKDEKLKIWNNYANKAERAIRHRFLFWKIVRYAKATIIFFATIPVIPIIQIILAIRGEYEN